MRLGWIILIVGLGTAAIGGRALYEAHAAGGKKDIAFARLIGDVPAHGWYKVTGASYSLADAVTLQGVTGGTLEHVYVRVHADGTDGADEAPAKLLVDVKDQKLADMVARILTHPDEPRLPGDTAKLAEAHPIEGVIEDVLTIDHTDQKGVRGALGERLADDYLVIAQGRTPDGNGRGILLLAVGLAIMALSALLLLRRGARPADEPAGD